MLLWLRSTGQLLTSHNLMQREVRQLTSPVWWEGSVRTAHRCTTVCVCVAHAVSFEDERVFSNLFEGNIQVSWKR